MHSACVLFCGMCASLMHCKEKRELSREGVSLIANTADIEEGMGNAVTQTRNGNEYNESVQKCINSIMTSIDSPFWWPKTAKKEFAESLQSYDIETVIREMVNKCKHGRHNGVHKLKECEVEQVISRLIANKEKFKEIAVRNFPPQNTRR